MTRQLDLRSIAAVRAYIERHKDTEGKFSLLDLKADIVDYVHEHAEAFFSPERIALDILRRYDRNHRAETLLDRTGFFPPVNALLVLDENERKTYGKFIRGDWNRWYAFQEVNGVRQAHAMRRKRRFRDLQLARHDAYPDCETMEEVLAAEARAALPKPTDDREAAT